MHTIQTLAAQAIVDDRIRRAAAHRAAREAASTSPRTRRLPRLQLRRARRPVPSV